LRSLLANRFINMTDGPTEADSLIAFKSSRLVRRVQDAWDTNPAQSVLAAVPKERTQPKLHLFSCSCRQLWTYESFRLNLVSQSASSQADSFHRLKIPPKRSLRPDRQVFSAESERQKTSCYRLDRPTRKLPGTFPKEDSEEQT
jgi:hypothetical protein